MAGRANTFSMSTAFDSESHAHWPKFIAWSRLTQLREVVSLEGILCPNMFHEVDRDAQRGRFAGGNAEANEAPRIVKAIEA